MADSKDMLKVIIDALQDKKAEDIRVIDISNVSVIADYFVIASGSNTNQIQAMVDNVEEEMFKAGFDDPKVEGYNTFFLITRMLLFMYSLRMTERSIILNVYGVMVKRLILTACNYCLSGFPGGNSAGGI